MIRKVRKKSGTATLDKLLFEIYHSQTESVKVAASSPMRGR
jgi:hypothetical protein